MKIILRNLSSGVLSLDFTGYDVTPVSVAILEYKSQIVETSLSVLEFRKIPDVAAALSIGSVGVSTHGGLKALN